MEQGQTTMSALENARDAGKSVDDIHYDILLKMYRDGRKNQEIVDFFESKGIMHIHGMRLVHSTISKLANEAGARKKAVFFKTKKSVEPTESTTSDKKTIFAKVVASACLTDEEVANLYGYLLGGK